MKNFKKLVGIMLSAVLTLISIQIIVFQPVVTAAESTVTVTESGGWNESAYVKWSAYTGAEGYNVYIKPVSGQYAKLDDMLVREYKDCFRADALGLAAGDYVMKVVPVVSGAEETAAAAETGTLKAVNYLREGFAFSAASPNKYTTGAYNQDGTLKSDAIVVYLTDANRDSLTIEGHEDMGKGINAIISKAKNLNVPLDVRILGKVRKPDGINLDSTMRVQDAKNITIEGVGHDATMYGWGLSLKRTNNIEIRNAAIMWHCNGTDGDAISLDTDNYNIFIHNMDFYYGAPGAEEDQKKGDGTVDMKARSDYITVSYNHFYDTGKSTFSGGQWELNNKLDPTAKVNVTYHHNWFDHSDSRHPRCVVGNTHVYNNYYEGNGYGAAACENASVFVENNYFENCSMPMMIGSQGSDAYRSAGSYSGSKNLSNQDGGMIKEYGNYMTGQDTFFNQENSEVEGQIDAYSVADPKDKVPETVKALKGGWAYNNFDTDASMYSYTPDTAETARDNVKKGAGRMNGGDLKWTFTSKDNKNGGIIAGLQSAIQNYDSLLLKAGGLSVEGTAPVEPEKPSEGTTEAPKEGGKLEDDYVWDLQNISTTPTNGLWSGEPFSYNKGNNTYISEDGYSYDIDGYITGTNNPGHKDGSKYNGGPEIPEVGGFIAVTAPDDGVMTTAIRTGSGSTPKTSYITDGVSNIKTVVNAGATHRFDVVRFNVKKGTVYYIFTAGSKIRIAYLGFTKGSESEEPSTEMTTQAITEAQPPISDVNKSDVITEKKADGSVSFIAGVSSVEYKEAGFIFESDGKKAERAVAKAGAENNKVYRSLKDSAVKPEQLKKEYEYAYTISDIPDGKEIKVTPYVITLAGEKIESDTKIYSMVQ